MKKSNLKSILFNRRKVVGLLLATVMCLILLDGFIFKTEAKAEDGLVLHLKFDGDLRDSSGNDNHANCEYGKITYDKGIHGSSVVYLTEKAISRYRMMILWI